MDASDITAVLGEIQPARTKYGKVIVRSRQAACGCCERLFVSTAAFLLHRRGRHCAGAVTMRKLGMQQRADGAWFMPLSEEDAEKLRALRESQEHAERATEAARPMALPKQAASAS